MSCNDKYYSGLKLVTHLHKVFEPNMYVIACSFEARYIYPPSLHITMADLIEYHPKIMIGSAHVFTNFNEFYWISEIFWVF